MIEHSYGRMVEYEGIVSKMPILNYEDIVMIRTDFHPLTAEMK